MVFGHLFQCVPYFDASGCQHPGCEPLYPTPDCIQTCQDNADYQTVKHYASNAYRVGSDPYDIMAEIYTNGPVEVSFHVYEVIYLYNFVWKKFYCKPSSHYICPSRTLFHRILPSTFAMFI